LFLNTLPSFNVVITITPDAQIDLGAGAGVAINRTFTPANAATPQTVNVTAVDDTLIEGNHTGIITHAAASADSDYNGIAIDTVSAGIADNELDWGDALDSVIPGPTGYPTYSWSNGARHLIGGPWLGDQTDKPDREPDGQALTYAEGMIPTGTTTRMEWTSP